MAIVATPLHDGASDVLGGDIVGVLVPPFVDGVRALVITSITVIIPVVVVVAFARFLLTGGELSH